MGKVNWAEDTSRKATNFEWIIKLHPQTKKTRWTRWTKNKLSFINSIDQGFDYKNNEQLNVKENINYRLLVLTSNALLEMWDLQYFRNRIEMSERIYPEKNIKL